MMGTQSYCVQLVIVVFCVFSLLILGRMKDEFADFELEPKMREEEAREARLLSSFSCNIFKRSSSAAKQLDDHVDDACYCIINVSGSLLLHANDNTSSCLDNQRGHASKTSRSLENKIPHDVVYYLIKRFWSILTDFTVAKVNETLISLSKLDLK